MAGPTYEEKRQIFERHFLLGKLTPGEVDTLLAYSRVERYPATTEIYAKGSPGNSMMLVLRGTAKMSSVSAEGKEIVLNIMNPGDLFGEIALLDGGERSADAVAMTDCEILVLNRRDFMPILEHRADICMMLLRILCQRLRQTSEQVEDVLFRHLESRVAKALLQLAERAGLNAVSGSPVELHVSQRELGNIAGGSRESVNKILQSWHKAGWIELGKGSIVIRDMAAIERLVLTPADRPAALAGCWWVPHIGSDLSTSALPDADRCPTARDLDQNDFGRALLRARGFPHRPAGSGGARRDHPRSWRPRPLGKRRGARHAGHPGDHAPALWRGGRRRAAAARLRQEPHCWRCGGATPAGRACPRQRPGRARLSPEPGHRVRRLQAPP